MLKEWSGFRDGKGTEEEKSDWTSTEREWGGKKYMRLRESGNGREEDSALAPQILATPSNLLVHIHNSLQIDRECAVVVHCKIY